MSEENEEEQGGGIFGCILPVIGVILGAIAGYNHYFFDGYEIWGMLAGAILLGTLGAWLGNILDVALSATAVIGFSAWELIKSIFKKR